MNYKKIVFFAFVLFSLQNTLFSQQMLWKVKGNYGGDVYLLGSIHVGKASMYPLTKEINSAFDRSSYLVLETKLDTRSTQIMQEAMFQKGRLEEGDTIEYYISESNYILLQEKLAFLKLDKRSMDGYKPWVAALILADHEIMRLGYSPVFGIDQHFWHRAIEQNKPVFSIEGAQTQAEFFSDSSKEFNEELLQMQMDALETKEESYALFQMWEEGNDSYFNEQMLNSLELYPRVKRSLLTQRNKEMAAKVKRYMNNTKGNSYFVIVGTAHLLGKEGVIELLQAEDVNITRY